MLNLNFKLQPQTEKKIKRILDQHPDKEIFFQDVIKNQINELKHGINNIEIDLRKFEQKYQQATKDFYRQFTNGELEDKEDFIVWAGIYEMQLENKKKLVELE
jgi:chromosome segregation and condensation protein ScpB